MYSNEEGKKPEERATDAKRREAYRMEEGRLGGVKKLTSQA